MVSGRRTQNKSIDIVEENECWHLLIDGECNCGHIAFVRHARVCDIDVSEGHILSTFDGADWLRSRPLIRRNLQLECFALFCHRVAIICCKFIWIDVLKFICPRVDILAEVLP